MEDAQSRLQEWRTLYLEVFSIEIDTSELRIPKRVLGFNWLIVVTDGLTPNKVFEATKRLCGAGRYPRDLDSITSIRRTDKAYAIWVRDRVEADEELKRKSAQDLKRESVNCITLEERMLLEIWYYRKTGKHLDLKSWTLCAGSLDLNGDVLIVCWDGVGGRVYVSWEFPSELAENLRARQVVS